MNFEEIIAEIQKLDVSVEELALTDIENPLPNIGPWEEVDKYGGEGKGDTWYSILLFKDHNVYIRTDGYYSSYNGTDFYDGFGCCKEVKPAQKTITVFE